MSNLINLIEMTNNDLVVLKGLIDKELTERKNKELTKLVEDFKKAFNALCEAGATIRYDDYLNDSFPLSDWNDFYIYW